MRQLEPACGSSRESDNASGSLRELGKLDGATLRECEGAQGVKGEGELEGES